MKPIQAEDWVYLYVELASVVEKHLLEKFKHQIDVDEFIEICNDIEGDGSSFSKSCMKYTAIEIDKFAVKVSDDNHEGSSDTMTCEK